MNNEPMPLKYKRVLLKCSGEALIGSMKFGIDPAILDRIARDVVELIKMDVEVGIVIGGGNLFRGKALSAVGLGRVTGDQMGMLATIMNALALRDALERFNTSACVMSAIHLVGIVEPHNQRHAIERLQDGQVVIFAGGTGNPYFTTDTAACVRAIEIEANIVLKATKVDGIYSDDPIKNPIATRYDFLTHQQVLQDGLAVMDSTAICLCQEHNMPIQVFDITIPNVLKEIVLGKKIGTFVGVSHDK